MSETEQHVENSTESLEKIEDTLMKIKVNEKEIEQSRSYLGKQDCQLFRSTGQCSYGKSCRYNHPLTYFPQGVPYYYIDQLPERIGQPDCEYFLRNGACKYGPRCIYHHPKDRNGAGPILFNVLGYPMRQDEKSCPYYMKTGLCRFGVACKFHHPEPSSGHSAAYPLSSFPSVSYPPYTGGLIMMPLLVPTYIPFMLASSQAFLPPQSCPATYMPPNLLNPILPTTVSISSPPPKSSDEEDSSTQTPSPKSEDSSPQTPPPKSEEEDSSPRSNSDHPSSQNEKQAD